MEPPEIIKLVHGPELRLIEIAKGDIIFWADGYQYQFPTIHAAEVVGVITEAHPQTLHIEEIFSRLNRKIHVGVQNQLSQTVYKYVSQARNAIVRAGVEPNFIQTVRNYGYRLGPGWTVDVSEQSLTALGRNLKELKHLVDRCIDHVRHSQIHTNSRGLLYVNLNKSELYENYLIIERISWDVLDALSRDKTISFVLRVKNDFDRLLTYVLFWRIGRGMMKNEWKDNFESEILEIFTDIEMRIHNMANKRNVY
jgi:hypothetical protein